MGRRGACVFEAFSARRGPAIYCFVRRLVKLQLLLKTEVHSHVTLCLETLRTHCGSGCDAAKLISACLELMNCGWLRTRYFHLSRRFLWPARFRRDSVCRVSKLEFTRPHWAEHRCFLFSCTCLLGGFLELMSRRVQEILPGGECKLSLDLEIAGITKSLAEDITVKLNCHVDDVDFII